MKLDIKKTNIHLIQLLLRLTIRDVALESYQVRPESLEGLFNPHPVKNENDASEIRFPTLITGAFPNQKFNKQSSHESKKTVDSSCISF